MAHRELEEMERELHALLELLARCAPGVDPTTGEIDDDTLDLVVRAAELQEHVDRAKAGGMKAG